MADPQEETEHVKILGELEVGCHSIFERLREELHLARLRLLSELGLWNTETANEAIKGISDLTARALENVKAAPWSDDIKHQTVGRITEISKQFSEAIVRRHADATRDD